MKLSLESLNDRLAPSVSPVHGLDSGSHSAIVMQTSLTDPTNGEVQLINCTPTAAVPEGTTFKFKVTVTLTDNSTWTQNFSVTGTLTATQVRDLLKASFVQAGFTCANSGDNAFIVSNQTYTAPDGTVVTLGIQNVGFTVVDAGGLVLPQRYLPIVSGTE